jgi:membrane-associated phospholipid phosphatase
MDAVAQWIGEHSVAVFLAGLMALLGVWFGLWRLFERYEEHWWQAAAFVGRHIAAYRYLSLHLLAGLAVCFGAVFAFGSVAEEILEPEDWAAFDRALAVALNRHATPLGVDVLGAITLLGDKWLIAAVAVAGGLGLALRRRRVLLAGWLASLAGGALLNLALKAAFRRARPEFDAPLATALGWSFPSGHAMGAMVAYGMVSYLLVLRFGRAPAPFIVAAGSALVLAVGFSRIYLGVHYFSDVVGGYLSGIAWLAVCVSAMEIARRHARGIGRGN